MQFDQCINTWLRGLTESSFSDDWEKLLPILFWPRSALVMDGFRQDLKEGQLFISDRDVESYNCGSHTIRSRTDAAGPTAVRDTSWSPRAAAAAFTHHSLNFAISSLFNKPASKQFQEERTDWRGQWITGQSTTDSQGLTVKYNICHSNYCDVT